MPRILRLTKPRLDFPLFPHKNGNWAKKIRSRMLDFGTWKGDPRGDAALAKYLIPKDDLQADTTPPDTSDGGTVQDLVNECLDAKAARLENGELSPRTFQGYRRTGVRDAEGRTGRAAIATH